MIDKALALLSSPYAPWAGASLSLIAILLFGVSLELRFRRRVRKLAEAPDPTDESPFPALVQILRHGYFIRRARVGFHGAPGLFPDLPARAGLVERWTERLAARRGGAGTMALALEFAADRALFPCMLSAIGSPRRARGFLAWLDASGGDFPLRRVALSSRGAEFDGAAARALLGSRLDEARELLGDPEWSVRTFAVRLILGDGGERSVKALHDGLSDPYPLARRLCIEGVPLPSVKDDLDRFGQVLLGIYLDDPSKEVREAARNRLRRDFPELLAIDVEGLSTDRATHILEGLDPERAEDESLAFHFLGKGDPGERLAAADYLDRRGSLARILESADPADAEEFERRAELLASAAALGATRFLSSAGISGKPACILLATRTLAKSGDPRLLAPLAAHAFSLIGETPLKPAETKLYEAALAAIAARGDASAFAAVGTELLASRHRPELVSRILDSIGAPEALALFDQLESLFFDGDFTLRDKLRAAILKAPVDLALPLAMKVARAGRQGYPHAVRKDAMLLLGAIKPKGAVQLLVENLSALPLDEAAEFAPVFAQADPEAFQRIARAVLDSVDAPARAALIAALPAVGAKPFMSDVKAALGDADPDVRAAAARALAALHEGKALVAGGLGLLRDPVERVRVASAAALADSGGPAAVESLRAVLADPNEVDEVKRSLFAGLGTASDQASLGLLVDALDESGPYRELAFAALGRRNAKKDLRYLAERFKDATGESRALVTEAFHRMGATGQEAVASLLDEDIPSLRPTLAAMLEETGWVEARIRELRRREPAVRRSAALALQSVGTSAAYRGIVIAARDPDGEVRAAVAKALEKLGGPDGAELLEQLQRDPDPRIRKYALWALERVKAKEL